MEIIINNARCEVKGSTVIVDDLLSQTCTYRDEGEFFVYLKWKRKQDRLEALIRNGSSYDKEYRKQVETNVRRYYKASNKCLYKVLKKGKTFPTGLLTKVEAALKSSNVKYKLTDKRVMPETLKYKFITKEPFFPDRYYQKAAINAALESNRGVIVSPTGTGKSHILNRIIWELGVKTVIITPSTEIKKMLHKSLIANFGKGKVESLSTKSVKTKALNVVNIQALVKMDPKVLEDVNCMIVDEFHHCLIGSTKLKTDVGVKTIRDIVDNNLDCKVLSYNKALNKFEYKKVIDRFRYNAPSDLIELKYESPTGVKTLMCTSEHKIFTKNRGYVEAGNLTLEDDVVIEKGYVCPICEKHYTSTSSMAGCKTQHLKPMSQKIEEGKSMSRHKNHNNPRARKLNSESKLGDRNPAKRKEVRLKKSVSQKAWWDSLSEEERTRRVTIFQNAPKQGVRKGPTSLERRVMSLDIDGLKFTGDGSLWVTSQGKHMNPDFVYKNSRKIVEVGDIEYWHTKEDIADRLAKYNDINFECLYLTSADMKYMTDERLKNKIQEFLNG